MGLVRRDRDENFHGGGMAGWNEKLRRYAGLKKPMLGPPGKDRCLSHVRIDLVKYHNRRIFSAQVTHAPRNVTRNLWLTIHEGKQTCRPM